MAVLAQPSLLRALRVVALAILACVCTIGPAQAGRIEAGTFVAHDTLGSNRTPDFVAFQESFDVPPIVIVLSNSNGGNSASVRVTNVTTTGFDELIIEPDNWDGRHLSMVTQYIAVEPGRHVLPDGMVIEAGRGPISATQFGSGFTGGTASWANVNFTAPLPSTPMILHQLQTANSETRDVANQSSRPHITSISQGASVFGFDLAIDRSQANSGPFPFPEDIGWIAWPTSSNGSFDALGGNTINWSTRTSPNTIRGWDDGCFSASHGLTGASNPVVITKKNSRNNQDGGWLRYCSISASDITVRIDEDRDQDTERSVAVGDAESIGIIAFSQSFHANLAADLSVTKIRSATDDQRGGNFPIPGAIITYQITVQNTGNAPPNEESVIVTEALPGDLALYVTDFATGSGPVQFTDGSPNTGLSCPFVSLASPSDCFSFSTDGTDFSHTPVDSGDGTDPNVTHVRIQPSGFMSGNSGAGAPRFTLRLRALLKSDLPTPAP